MNVPILTTLEDIKSLAADLAQETEIAVDLEADSLHSYSEKVCLLQVSWGERTVLLDPLPLPHLDPLKEVLADPSIIKIFHAADYDIRSLHRDFDIEINGLFDTMISSQFAGEEKWGLADQLNNHFGIELDKQYQRADWSIRPLTEGMIQYAASDTAHLFKLKTVLKEKLDALERLSWVEEEFKLLEKVRMPDNTGPKFVRFKGAGKLDRRQLAVLEELLQWRDAEARKKDRPLFKVIGNKPLLEVALKCPASRRGLGSIEILPPRLLNRYSRPLLDAVERGMAIPKEELPVFPRGERRERDPEAEDRLLALKKWRTAKAAELKLDAGVLINNATMETVARANPSDLEQLQGLEVLKDWQIEVLGGGMLKCCH